MSLKALQDYTFVSKYARYNEELKRRETWDEAVDRVKDMHLQKYPQNDIKEDIEWAFDRVREKRVLGSQRALQFGGKPVLKKNARLYNCFSVETSFISNKGVKSFSDFSHGDEITVLTHKGNWKKAIVKNYGKQELHQIEVKRNGATYKIWATTDHRWILKSGNLQEGVSIGDNLLESPDIFNEFNYDVAPPEEKLYWAYGMIYGDGTRLKHNGVYSYSMIRLCDNDRKYKCRFEELGFKTSSSLSLEGDFIAHTGTYLKTLPNPEVDEPRLIRAFVRGYLDADGTKNKNITKNTHHKHLNRFNSIQSSNEDGIKFIKKCFPIAGSYVVSETDLTGQETNFGTRGKTSSFRVFNQLGKTAAQFKVISNGDNEEIRYEDVWCLEVEDDHSFVFPFGLTTGNCISSYCDRLRFFQESFWLLLCGTGVGFSVQKHHVAKLPELVERKGQSKVYVIPDSIEGWADSLGVLMSSYFGSGDFTEYAGYNVEFNYSLIRPEGSKLGSSSGKAPGPDPLRRALEKITELLERCLNDGLSKLRSIDAYDIIMHTSDAVLSGGVRRSATLCMFSPDDQLMATAKTGNWFNENPQRGRSNNSALLIREETTYEQFLALMESVKEYGEPGFIWSDNLEGLFNPCVEVNLYAYDEYGNSGWQACNLCEINGKKIKTEEDFAIAAKAAAIIGTLQAGYTNFEYLGETSERIIKKEALLGVSITGMMDSPEILFDPKLQRKMAKMILKVNDIIAVKIGINPCARGTCNKPAGTTSCILGTASGIHPHHARRYIRRSQGNKLEAPLQHFKAINPNAVEKSVWSANGTDEVIAFCVEVPKGAKIKNDLDATTLLEYVKLTQQNWVMSGTRTDKCVKKWLHHNVSNTITVKPDEWEEVAKFIFKNRRHFAGISLLPQSGDKDYPQAPFAAIYTPTELAKMYGDGMPMASGLVVDGLHEFDNNLWVACDEALGVTDMPEPLVNIEQATASEVFEHERKMLTWHKKKDWCRRVQQFADRYLEGDIRQATYLMKDVHNWKMWCDLQREYKNVDYTLLFEESDETKLMAASGCAGGKCDLQFA